MSTVPGLAHASFLPPNIYLPPLTSDIVYLNDHGELLENSLLTPRDLLPGQPLPMWIASLRSSLPNRWIGQAMDHAAQIAAIYEQTAIILIAMGMLQNAREIAYTQIQLFLNWSTRTNKPVLLKYVFQPWLQLIRLDRQEGNYRAAHQKIDALNFSQTQSSLDHPFLTKLLSDIYHLDPECAQTIKQLGMVERIYTYLETKSYNELTQFLSLQSAQDNPLTLLIQYEAFVIALANNGKVSEALKLLAWIKSHAHHEALLIFNLRELELSIALAPHAMHVSKANALVALSLRQLKSEVTTTGIRFCLHTVNLLKKIKLFDQARKILYECLACCEHYQFDEMKGECLVSLYAIVLPIEGRKIIEDMMIEHYCATHYVSVRQLLLANFNDLKHVEIQHGHEQALILFEELLAFANNYFCH